MGSSLKAFLLSASLVSLVSACGGGGSSAPAAVAAAPAAAAAAGSLTLGGVNNSALTAFVPGDSTTCFAVKTAALLNVNCNNLSPGQSFMFTLEGAPAVGVTYNVKLDGSATGTNVSTAMSYTLLLSGRPVPPIWKAIQGGTVKITDLTATSATVVFTGVSLANLNTTSATGNVTVDGTITFAVR